jgi:hypothetical protein
MLATTSTKRARNAKHIYCYWATVAKPVPSCYRSNVARFRERAPALRAISVSAIAVAVAAACSRSDLAEFGAGGVSDNGAGGSSARIDGAATSVPPLADATALLPEASLDAAVPPVPTGTTSSGPPTMPPPTALPTNPAHPPNCIPREETCNGADDDCNGQVDDGIGAIPCPGGGQRFCVAGNFSRCPKRCETCIPGSERVCFLSYCTFWAGQVCASDGRSFGVCRERHLPPECDAIATKYKASPELERCCLDNGYCCRDEFDLDDDGNNAEMLGKCDEVSCD